MNGNNPGEKIQGMYQAGKFRDWPFDCNLNDHPTMQRSIDDQTIKRTRKLTNFVWNEMQLWD